MSGKGWGSLELKQIGPAGRSREVAGARKGEAGRADGYQVETHVYGEEPPKKKATTDSNKYRVLYNKSLLARQYNLLKRYRGGKWKGAWRQRVGL